MTKASRASCRRRKGKLARQQRISELETQLSDSGGDNTEHNLVLTLKLNEALVGALPDNWRGDQGKERIVMGVIHSNLDDLDPTLRVEETMRLYKIVKQYPEEY